MSAFVFSRQCFAHLFSARPGGDQSDKFLDRDRDAGAELREIPKTFFSVLLILLETSRLFGVGDLVPGRLSVRSLFGRDSDLFRLEMTLAGPHFRSCPSSGCVRLGEADRPGSLKSGNPLALLPPSYAWWLRRRDEIRTLYPTGTGRHRPRSPALRIAGRKMHLARNLPRHQSPARPARRTIAMWACSP